MTKANRLPRQSHHKSRPKRRSDNNSINARHFFQTPREAADAADFSSDEYDDCAGYESAPGYDSSLERSSDYDPFFGCDSSSGAPSSFGSRAASPDSKDSDHGSDGRSADSNSPHPLVARKERIAQERSSGATQSTTADSKNPKSNGSPDAASKARTTSFAPVGTSAFSSSKK